MTKRISIDLLLQKYPDRAARVILRSYGFKSFYVETSVGTHHAYQQSFKGTLPPVVLLHGGGDSAAGFIPLILQLRRHVKEITILEAVGHGLSREPSDTYGFEQHYASMNQALDNIIGEPAVLIGNSLGGTTALHYARHNPAKVCGLFLSSPMGAPMTAEELHDLRTSFTPHTFSEARAFARRANPNLSPLREAVVSRILLSWMNRQAISDLVRTTTTEDGVDIETLQSLKMPIRIVAGRDDRIMTPNAISYFRSHLPKSTTILLLQNMGHTPHHDLPKIIAKMILDFMKALK